MTTYTKIVLAIAGLILIPAVLINQNYISADYFNLSAGTSSITPNLPTSTGSGNINTTTPNNNITTPGPDDPATSFPNIIVTPDDPEPLIDTFLFFDINIFSGLSDLIKIIPIIGIPLPPDTSPPIPPIDTDNTQVVTITSLYESWQEIKDKPIGVVVDEDIKTKIFEERKQIFDAWFEKEWQKITDPITGCDDWWCIDTPDWVKNTAYNLTKFDFSYDWAWDQFIKDNL